MTAVATAARAGGELRGMRAVAIGGRAGGRPALRGMTIVAIALLAAAALPAAPAAARPPRVETMVVGQTRVLFGPRAVTARATTVRAGGRRCAVGAATPLAALAAARRAGAPGFAVRDFGSCSRSARDAGGLFVDRIGRERNRGRNGWTYKVGTRAGTAGAADPAGSFGDGRRLRRGARVLWFWCRLGPRGCQRTLVVRPAAHRVAPGAPLAVRVVGYDDAGRGRPVAGARVTLGRRSALTGRGGRATLVAPRAGRHALRATRRGMVTAFPERVVVR